MKKIDASNVQQFYFLIDGLKEDVAINQPGNITYFIKWTKKNKTLFEAIWDGSDDVDIRLRMIYKLMGQHCLEDRPTR